MFLRPLLFLALLTCLSTAVVAQKPFTEGVIVYKVKMLPEDPEFKPGTFTLTVKGDEIKKEMKMSNQDYVVIINCQTNKVISLQSRNGKKYAIELQMDDMVKDQEKFKGYNIQFEKNENKKMAGYVVSCGDVVYRDGSKAVVTYSKEWKPAHSITFERFPGADFFPLDFFYKDASGIGMRFEVEKIDPGPVENAVFRVPHDYKIISYAEYKTLSN